MKTISDLGEEGLIRLIERQFGQLGTKSKSIGIGDDCAVIPISRRQSLLVTTDLLVEGVHFLRDGMSAADLGHKALAVNLSDIAAMGGVPESAFLSWALPADCSLLWLRGFLRGMQTLAARHKVELLGGDTTASPDRIFINLTVLGHAHPRRIKLRSTARPGDLVCVTNHLGDSRAGLELILSHATNTAHRDETYLLRRHRRPRPHIEEGQWLAKQKTVHALMDTSDGLNSDARKIIMQSKVGIDVDLDRLPISAQLARYCEHRHRSPQELAAIGGEDYTLLLTCEEAAWPRLERDFRSATGSRLFAIGRVTTHKGRLRYLTKGHPTQLSMHSFEHFRKR